jgi:DNA polymerase
MDKLEALKKLEEELISNDSLPLRESNLVFGEGNHNCDVMFIGEAPGMNEDKLKRPFVGRAGKLLDVLIKSIGWEREQVYITNIVKRRPPENRDPLPEEIESYKPYLARQIEIINPRVIATLGRFSMNYFLPSAKIMRDQGKLFKWVERGEKGGNGTVRFIVPIIHPAAALRATSVLEALEASFKKLPAILVKIEELSKAPVPKSSPESTEKEIQESLF